MTCNSVSPTVSVLEFLRPLDNRVNVGFVIESWWGVKKTVEEVLASCDFDTVVRLFFRGHQVGANDCEKWLAHAAYKSIVDTPAAFLVQVAMDRENGEEHMVNSLMRNPTARCGLGLALLHFGAKA